MLSDEEFHERRAEALRRILESDARQKLIVAGPGTGKTYTFQQVLAAIEGRGLAMTFLLGLVKDLDEEMEPILMFIPSTVSHGVCCTSSTVRA